MSADEPAPFPDRNRDTSAAWEYHRATNHSPESVRADRRGLDWSNQPRPYKLYARLQPQPLPEPADAGMPALAAIAPPATHEASTDTPDLEALTSILQYSNGITRRLPFPGGIMDFRAAACTGALYHIELYVVCADLSGLEAGVYQFGAHDRALRRLRSGDLRGVLLRAAADEEAIAAAPVTLVYTSTYWRNAWKYQARTYRHCFWDSGTVLANTLALAATWGLPARLVTGFVDDELNRLLDLDDQREAALALVPLGHNPARPAPPAPALAPLGLETVPYSRSEVDYPAIRRMHAASALGAPDEVADWRASAPTPRPTPASGPVIPLHPPEPAGLAGAPLEQVIRQRGSARRFEEEPISVEELSTVLAAATAAIDADFRGSPAAALSMPYLIVRAVDGLQSGAYVYHADIQTLELLAPGDFTSEARHLDLDQDLGAQAAVDVYFLTDLRGVLAALGNRGYRAAQLDAAIMAGRLYLAAYALGLGATGLTFYDDEVISFFSPHAAGKSVMFLLALGVPPRRRSSPR